MGCLCAECRSQIADDPIALLGQASAVFEHVEGERSEPNDSVLAVAERAYLSEYPLAPPSTPTDLLTMHLRAMCAVVRSLAGYLPYEQQVQLWAAEEACRG